MCIRDRTIIVIKSVPMLVRKKEQGKEIKRTTTV